MAKIPGVIFSDSDTPRALFERFEEHTRIANECLYAALLKGLRQCQWNEVETAKLLGIKRGRLRTLLKARPDLLDEIRQGRALLARGDSRRKAAPRRRKK